MQIKKRYPFFTRTTSLILCCILIFAACAKEEVLSSPEERDRKMVTLSVEMGDRSDTPGSDSEINKVRIIAFDSHNGGLLSNELFTPPATPVQITILSGTRDFYAITNEPENRTETLNAVKSLQDLQAVYIPYDEVQQGETFVSFGSLLQEEIKPEDTSKITIRNKRLAVKINLTLNGHSTAPTLVEFSNLPDKIPLFEVPYEPESKITVRVGPLTEPDAPTEGYIWSRTATVVLPSYLFTPEDNENKAARIVVSQDADKRSAPIGHRTSKGDYTLKRNHIYSLTANIAPDGLIIESQVRNWEKSEEDYPAGGGYFVEPLKDVRVGLEGTEEDAKGIFSARLATNSTDIYFRWYRISQKANDDFTLVTKEIDPESDTNTSIVVNDNFSELTLKADGLDDACMVYCVATITAPDGKKDRLESNYATFMPTGDWKAKDTYPAMQNWKIPRNAPLGSTCLLEDTRDQKIYRIKLMADGNWWMIQDLAYGTASEMEVFKEKCEEKGKINLIAEGLYGVCTPAGAPTGGYLYNGYAVAQMPEPTHQEALDEIAKDSTQYQSICPDGWHLPGNMNGEYNVEWSTLQKAIKVDNNEEEIMNEFVKFGYNNPNHFGAYNLNVANPNSYFKGETVTFAGGLFVGVVRFEIEHGFLGFTSVLDQGAVTVKGTGFPEQSGAPLRCLRDFK
ncbi:MULTISPECIES: hypothetical protein [Parabacteroides]|uniref:hypothetical protein n=1 Tax=Parabacteroides leei TaxID=2939491 RepID=UPI001899F7C8|nr:hypothetical protein [Parabacteroides goldsteinii]